MQPHPSTNIDSEIFSKLASPRLAGTGTSPADLPAPTPRREDVSFYTGAGAAHAAGFQPCLRCRRETSPARMAESR